MILISYRTRLGCRLSLLITILHPILTLHLQLLPRSLASRSPFSHPLRVRVLCAPFSFQIFFNQMPLASLPQLSIPQISLQLPQLHTRLHLIQEHLDRQAHRPLLDLRPTSGAPDSI
ncbi:hypothetical protein FA95DRAFT_672735 [Auriscalpium vulgare]|uniref:Uncharacterized protein n=1 Tax=Auriscalpium vulgare TaxID=40419 RepID=A0ACB8RBU6_9AGAM|nr:hypothetical protein FA95DRAFT_672735 [Auriscalpium vulgare]